jgi:hypothetical protein
MTMQQTRPTREARDNAATIKSVPPELLDEQRRAAYIARALAGEDVYAYHGAAGWNVWDIEAGTPENGYNGRVELGEVKP